MSADVLDIADPASASAAQPGRLRAVLISIIAVAALTVAVAAGFVWGSRGDASASPSAVDIGFSRDMATHHQQAITMAIYARDNSDNSAVATTAFDVESSQSVQLGQMTGWLEQWHVSRNTDASMAWLDEASMSSMHMAGMHMSADDLMPGMATPAQMTALRSSSGRKLDILFLQLMIRHHQGGIPMAQYAVEHATEDYVRTLAQAMVNTQSLEITQMEALLRQLGGTPLPSPVN